MSKIKMTILQKNLTPRQVYEQLGIDKYDFSKIANGKYLPTGEQLLKLCEILEIEPIELLNQTDIEIYGNLFNKPYKPQKIKSEQDVYKLSVRLPKRRCNLLQHKENLQRLGYKNLQDWIWQKFLETECQLNELDQNERKAKK